MKKYRIKKMIFIIKKRKYNENRFYLRTKILKKLKLVRSSH